MHQANKLTRICKLRGDEKGMEGANYFPLFLFGRFSEYPHQTLSYKTISEPVRHLASQGHAKFHIPPIGK